jgi:hypothetical protein
MVMQFELYRYPLTPPVVQVDAEDLQSEPESCHFSHFFPAFIVQSRVRITR